MALSHATSDSRPREAATVERIYRGTTTNIHARTRDQVLALLGDDLELVEPRSRIGADADSVGNRTPWSRGGGR